MALSEKDMVLVARYALDTGDESVTEQYEEVQSVRLRASFLFTVNALSASLFAQFLPDNFEITLQVAISVFFFVVCNLFCVFLMMPSGNWKITKKAGKIVSEFIDSDQELSAGQVFGILAIKTDDDQVKNEAIVASAHNCFRGSVYSFVASNVFWVWALAQIYLP